MVAITGSTLIHRPVEEVFDFVADERNEPTYNPRMVRAKKTTPGSLGTGTRWVATMRTRGRPLHMATEVTAYDRPCRLGSTSSMVFGTVHGEVSFQQAPGGTLALWSWDLTPARPLAPLAPLLARVGQRQEEATWATLKERLEDGAPEPAPEEASTPTVGSTVRGGRGSELACFSLGTGPAVVYLPGLSTHHGPPTGLGRWVERHEVKAYARRHHVWWMQRPAGLPVGTSMADLADAYADVLHDAFDHPVDVVGFSTGGSVALQLAADHPDLVRRLVLLSAACRLGPVGRDEQRDLAGLLRAHRTRDAGALLLSLAPVHRPPQRAMAALGWLLGPVIFRGDPGDLLVTVDAEDGFDLTARLSTVAARTLVVGGGRDRFYGTDLFRETATGLPQGRMLLHPQKGHIGAHNCRETVQYVLRFLDER